MSLAMFKKLFCFINIFLVLFLLESCTCSGGKNRTDSQWVNDMAQQNSVKAQEGTKEGVPLMKVPPEGTRARNRSYYPYPGDPILAGEKLKNPLKKNEQVLNQGKVYYERYCIYCHGSKGDAGEGATVVPKMILKPPSLLTDKAKGHTDGRMYHIIYEGQGLMGPYRIQLNTKNQVLLSHYVKDFSKEYKGSPSIWSVVHYLRFLQQEDGANSINTQKDNKEPTQDSNTTL